VWWGRKKKFVAGKKGTSFINLLWLALFRIEPLSLQLEEYFDSFVIRAVNQLTH
jgi:hypothetical protein